MNTSGMNTAASEIVMDMIVKLISFALLIDASKRLTTLDTAHRVLEKDDRIVNKKADR